MTDETQLQTTDDQAEAVEIGEHPHAGIAQEGFSTPLEDPGISSGHLAKLVLKRHGAETDIEFPIHPPSVIGRFDPAHGPIDIDLGSLDPEGSYISRKHATIDCDADRWFLRDMDSSNGTFLLRHDFERIEQADLADGDEIAFGNARFVFRLVACQPDPEPEAQAEALT